MGKKFFCGLTSPARFGSDIFASIRPSLSLLRAAPSSRRAPSVPRAACGLLLRASCSCAWLGSCAGLRSFIVLRACSAPCALRLARALRSVPRAPCFVLRASCSVLSCACSARVLCLRLVLRASCSHCASLRLVLRASWSCSAPRALRTSSSASDSAQLVLCASCSDALPMLRYPCLVTQALPRAPWSGATGKRLG